MRLLGIAVVVVTEDDPGCLPELSCLLAFLLIDSQEQLCCFLIFFFVAKINIPVLAAETKWASAWRTSVTW